MNEFQRKEDRVQKVENSKSIVISDDEGDDSEKTATKKSQETLEVVAVDDPKCPEGIYSSFA